MTVASNLESSEPLWFGRERKKETLDGFLEKELSPFNAEVSSGVRGHVGAVPEKHRTMGAGLSHHV